LPDHVFKADLDYLTNIGAAPDWQSLGALCQSEDTETWFRLTECPGLRRLSSSGCVPGLRLDNRRSVDTSVVDIYSVISSRLRIWKTLS
jgi:hypothetical protein